MTPSTLRGHGEGCEILADKFGNLAELLHQAQVDDQCFGPIGEAVGLAGLYLDGVEECRDLATNAREFLKHQAVPRRHGQGLRRDRAADLRGAREGGEGLAG